MKKITKEFLVKKMFDKWMAESPEIVKDLSGLASELTMFSIKWGITFKIEIEDREEEKGRNFKI